MCISIVALFLIAMLSPSLPSLGADGGLRYSIMVSKFQNRSNWSGQWDLGAAWGAVLRDSLQQTGKFIVLGEKDMRQEAMEEQDLADSERTAGGGKTVAAGQITRAQLLIKGDITHFADHTEGGGGGIGIGGFRIGTGGSIAEINAVLYVVDSNTGQVLASRKCYGKVSDTGLSLGLSRGGFSGDLAGFKKTNAGKAVEQAVDEGVAFIISKVPEIPWTGEIVLVKGDKVYINRGSREGVSVGQTLQVGRVDVLRDPKTGEVLDQTIEKSGTLEVVAVKEKVSTCKITQGSGITSGMTVMSHE
jgi:curli biogenesis system outer membrane secretion channel CsgG